MSRTEQGRAEAALRAKLREAGLDVEAVAWVRRYSTDNFAAIKIRTPSDEWLALEVITDPRCPLTIVAQTPTRWFVAPDPVRT